MSEADREREEMAIEQAVASLRRREMKAARLQLTCAALTGLYAEGTAPERVPAWAVAAADACLALLYPEPSASDGGGGER